MLNNLFLGFILFCMQSIIKLHYVLIFTIGMDIRERITDLSEIEVQCQHIQQEETIQIFRRSTPHLPNKVLQLKPANHTSAVHYSEGGLHL